jgi:hypothetical protein
MRLIGLAGKAGSGKDTVADHLVDRGWERYALAGPLKRGLCATFGLSMEHFTDRDLKEQVIEWIGKSPRQLAQLYGTEFGRQLVADDIWLRIAEQAYLHACASHAAGFVVTDVRFVNEARWIRSMGGEVWRLERCGAGTVSTHVSELPLADDLVDVSILNDRSFDDLYRVVDLTLANRYPSLAG